MKILHHSICINHFKAIIFLPYIYYNIHALYMIKKITLNDKYTHIALPRKSSWVKPSSSINFISISQTSSETVKRNVSFHFGLDPAPVNYQTQLTRVLYNLYYVE